MLSFVWAEDDARAIGYKGHLPWHLPADLHHFKEKTLNHPILMGRRTFDSLPGILPKRHHLVLSSDPTFYQKYQANPQVDVFKNEAELFAYLKEHPQDLICVIGGSSLFKLLKDEVDVLEKTKIKHSFPADTYMPEIDYDDFILTKAEFHPKNAENPYAFSFETYLRK